MDKRTKKLIRRLIFITLSGAIIGCIVGFVRGLELGGLQGIEFGISKGILIGSSISLFTSVFGLAIYPQALKRFSFTAEILIKTITYTLIVITLFILVSYLFTPVISFKVQVEMLVPVIIITIGATLVSTFMMSIDRLLGRRILLNFFTGKYHHPVEEERIFMFADLVSSTTIAEKIGHIEFHKFLNDFFFDITFPVIESNGEIYKYVGDELIAVWHVKDADTNYRCMNCYFEMKEEIEKQKNKYLKSYGFTPTFRVGMHCGTVITGEMGDYKREIAFLGDVVNTTARIQEESKAHKQDVLISGKLMSKINFPKEVNTESMGIVKLRGKETELELFAVRKI